MNATETTITTSRAAILDGLRRFIAQRSGIDARNYQRDYRDKEGAAAFRADYRGILRDGREARLLLEWIERTPSISAEAIAARATPGARLSLSADGATWNYTAGQYFAVEYRAAACRTLAGIIWDYMRDGWELKTADDIRAAARRNFGRGIASRWFR
jgi:hypothetical protein